MNQDELFDITRNEINEFRGILESKLDDRESATLHAIMRNDSWGDLAEYAAADSENPELSDLSDKFDEFSNSMQESENAWGEE